VKCLDIYIFFIFKEQEDLCNFSTTTDNTTW